MHDVRRELCIQYEEPVPTESEDSDERKKPSIFRNSIIEESKALGKISNDFLEKIKYNNQFKQVELGHIGKGEMLKGNPKLTIFEQSIVDRDLAMPLIEKVENQTLIL